MRSSAAPRGYLISDSLGVHIRELTAIHAHADALALAVAEVGADGFRDGELAAALFDIEERLMHVRDGIGELPALIREAAHA